MRSGSASNPAMRARSTAPSSTGWADARPDRPFFAFLNYFDAHEPYLPPPEFVGRFGIRPRTARDYEFLLDYMAVG